ncbi:indole-3-glycerol phosphate synthase TrpC [Aureispira anguillae]|uniref:indole-3-glycerol-phosphate synthase n=1 Tax=Aureispira anguillae TaxID=2864201 RepID=A0A916DW67_9BACT|nr:indole-3-glycerol phosphate synthase TrpC [Aureispira anguillae]BDS14487.1 indole-3-glycerol phosphate synthase TrpC [Aureispira anguillae]
MKTILDTITAYKRKEVENQKALYPTQLLEKSIYFETAVVSLVEFLKRPDMQGIIAEFKRQSPSKGIINSYAKVEEVSIGYMQAGASALSVLTDNHFFGGSTNDLIEARTFNYAPILNKNFVIDEYQIVEAKSIGADVVLLIAECLTKQELKRLAQFAKGLGMEVLMELHTQEQLEKVCPEVDLVGVNNRNLKTFEVDLENSLRIAEQLPVDVVKVAESGINNPDTVVLLQQHGFEGFLIGEYFMKHARPQEACARFIQQVAQKNSKIIQYES